MLRVVSVGWRLVVVALVAFAGAEAAAQKPRELEWSHAFDLKVRKFGEADFNDKTQKFGVEVFKDDNNDLAVYVSEKGGLAVGERFKDVKPPAGNKGPEWLTGLDLPARKAGQKVFEESTKALSLEAFRDPNLDNWLFITEKGDLAVSRVKGGATGGNKAPRWLHSFDLSSRKGGVKEWSGATKYGVEVYRDDNTGDLIYVCGETGAIAALAGAGEVKEEKKAPEWLHGLDLSCRKASEPSFTKETRKLGVEVYHDETTGAIVFISEVGSLSVIAAPANVKAPTARVQEPRWSHGLNVKCRAVGEKEFSEQTQVLGIEVFRDDNVRAILYVNEHGKIGAAAAK